VARFFDRKNINDNWQGGKQSDVMFGNGGHDMIRGGGGNDEIYGGTGRDTLYGDDGNDLIRGNEENDYIDGGAGDDRLYGDEGMDNLLGGDGADSLQGGDGMDALYGDAGNDEIGGGLGADAMWGGAGIDAFYWFTQSESDVTNGIDSIQDYDPSQDKLWFQPEFDANAGLAGRQHWEFVGASPTGTHLANGNGQATVEYVPADGYTTVSFYDNDGDFNPDMIIKLVGNVASPQFMIWLDGSPSGSFGDPAILYG